jgi:endonuclease G
VVARPDALDADSNRMGDVGTAGDAAARAAPARGAHAADLALRPGGASFSVPLTVSLTIGAPGGARAGAQLDASARAASRSADLSLRVPARSGDGGDGEDGGGDGDGAFDSGAGTASEAVSIDPDYANRKGYDARFLVPANAAAGHAREVPLPKLSAAQVALAARLSAPQPGRDPLVLDYHHFSVVMNRARKLAFFTAVNIDGRRHFMIQREADRWYYDPRIARSAQAGEAIYRANPLDRGHLVRRLDPAWGSSRPVAKKANDDTFHFTNCSPQHAEFNQRDALWAGLEDYVLQNARTEDLKVTVFTGPVFRAGDPPYRGIRIPTEYWKVVAIGVAGGKLSATAYVVSQSDQIADLEEFAFGAYRTFQVRVSEVERLTGLDFGSLRQHDPLAAAAPGGGPHEAHGEAFGTGRRELFDPGQIVL